MGVVALEWGMGSCLCENKMAQRKRADSDRLYKIKIVEEDGERVKVHYVGYSKKEDEWKRRDELVLLSGELEESTGSSESSAPTHSNESEGLSDTTGCSYRPNLSLWQPFSLYQELGSKIKLKLQNSRKESPKVKIEMPFDKLLFDGRLRNVGVKKRMYYGIERYTIRSYTDLYSLLGKGWHWRGLNEAGDFCYVVLSTVEFYIHRKRPLKEFFPPSYKVSSAFRDTGYCLVFLFVRGDGTPSEFGTNTAIFCDE